MFCVMKYVIVDMYVQFCGRMFGSIGRSDFSLE